jgi:hypothetical protein
MYRATERLRDALEDQPVVQFQDTIFVGDESAFKVSIEEVAKRVKPPNVNV